MNVSNRTMEMVPHAPTPINSLTNIQKEKICNSLLHRIRTIQGKTNLNLAEPDLTESSLRFMHESVNLNDMRHWDEDRSPRKYSTELEVSLLKKLKSGIKKKSGSPESEGKQKTKKSKRTKAKATVKFYENGDYIENKTNARLSQLRAEKKQNETVKGKENRKKIRGSSIVKETLGREMESIIRLVNGKKPSKTNNDKSIIRIDQDHKKISKKRSARFDEVAATMEGANVKQKKHKIRRNEADVLRLRHEAEGSLISAECGGECEGVTLITATKKDLTKQNPQTKVKRYKKRKKHTRARNSTDLEGDGSDLSFHQEDAERKNISYVWQKLKNRKKTKDLLPSESETKVKPPLSESNLTNIVNSAVIRLNDAKKSVQKVMEESNDSLRAPSACIPPINNPVPSEQFTTKISKQASSEQLTTKMNKRTSPEQLTVKTNEAERPTSPKDKAIRSVTTKDSEEAFLKQTDGTHVSTTFQHKMASQEQESVINCFSGTNSNVKEKESYFLEQQSSSELKPKTSLKDSQRKKLAKKVKKIRQHVLPNSPNNSNTDEPVPLHGILKDTSPSCMSNAKKQEEIKPISNKTAAHSILANESSHIYNNSIVQELISGKKMLRVQSAKTNQKTARLAKKQTKSASCLLTLKKSDRNLSEMESNLKIEVKPNLKKKTKRSAMNERDSLCGRSVSEEIKDEIEQTFKIKNEENRPNQIEGENEDRLANSTQIAEKIDNSETLLSAKPSCTNLTEKDVAKKVAKNTNMTISNLNEQMSNTLKESIGHLNDICMRVRSCLTDIEKDELTYRRLKAAKLQQHSQRFSDQQSECESVFDLSTKDISMVSLQTNVTVNDGDKTCTYQVEELQYVPNNTQEFTMTVEPCVETTIEQMITTISLGNGEIPVGLLDSTPPRTTAGDQPQSDSAKIERSKMKKRRTKKVSRVKTRTQSSMKLTPKESRTAKISSLIKIDSTPQVTDGKIPIWQRNMPSIIEEIQLTVKKQATRSQYKEFLKTLKHLANRERTPARVEQKITEVELQPASMPKNEKISNKHQKHTYQKIKDIKNALEANNCEPKKSCIQCQQDKCTCGIKVENVQRIGYGQSRQKLQWMKTRSDTSYRSFQTYDILDEITLKDVEPLQSEYPRKDHLTGDEGRRKVQDTLLYQLVYNQDPKILETLLRSPSFLDECTKSLYATMNAEKSSSECPVAIRRAEPGIRPKSASNAYRLYEKFEFDKDIGVPMDTSAHKAALDLNKEIQVVKPPKSKLKVAQMCPKDFNDMLTMPIALKLKNSEDRRDSCPSRIHPNSIDEKEALKKIEDRLKLINKKSSGKSLSKKIKRGLSSKAHVKAKLRPLLTDPNFRMKKFLTVMRVLVDYGDQSMKFAKERIKSKLRPYMIDPTPRVNVFTVMPVQVKYQFINSKGAQKTVKICRSATDSRDSVPTKGMSKRDVIRKLKPYIFMHLPPNTVTVMPVTAKYNPRSENPTDFYNPIVPYNPKLGYRTPDIIKTEYSAKPTTSKKANFSKDHGDDCYPFKKLCRKCIQADEEVTREDLIVVSHMNYPNGPDHKRWITSYNQKSQPEHMVSFVVKKNKPRPTDLQLEANPLTSSKGNAIKGRPSDKINKKQTPAASLELNQGAATTRNKLREVRKMAKKKDMLGKEMENIIEMIEMKIVDILSNPRHGRGEAFQDVEREIKDVLQAINAVRIPPLPTTLNNNQQRGSTFTANLTEQTKVGYISDLKSRNYVMVETPCGPSSLPRTNEITKVFATNRSLPSSTNQELVHKEINAQDIDDTEAVEALTKPDDLVQIAALTGDNTAEEKEAQDQQSDKSAEKGEEIGKMKNEDQQENKQSTNIDEPKPLRSEKVEKETALENMETIIPKMIHETLKEQSNSDEIEEGPGEVAENGTNNLDCENVVSSFCKQVDYVIKKITIEEPFAGNIPETASSPPEDAESEAYLTPYMRAVKEYRRTERSQSFMDFLDELSRLSQETMSVQIYSSIPMGIARVQNVPQIVEVAQTFQPTNYTDDQMSRASMTVEFDKEPILQLEVPVDPIIEQLFETYEDNIGDRFKQMQQLTSTSSPRETVQKKTKNRRVQTVPVIDEDLLDEDDIMSCTKHQDSQTDDEFLDVDEYAEMSEPPQPEYSQTSEGTQADDDNCANQGEYVNQGSQAHQHFEMGRYLEAQQYQKVNQYQQMDESQGINLYHEAEYHHYPDQCAETWEHLEAPYQETSQYSQMIQFPEVSQVRVDPQTRQYSQESQHTHVSAQSHGRQYPQMLFNLQDDMRQYQVSQQHDTVTYPLVSTSMETEDSSEMGEYYEAMEYPEVMEHTPAIACELTSNYTDTSLPKILEEVEAIRMRETATTTDLQGIDQHTQIPNEGDHKCFRTAANEITQVTDDLKEMCTKTVESQVCNDLHCNVSVGTGTYVSCTNLSTTPRDSYEHVQDFICISKPRTKSQFSQLTAKIGAKTSCTSFTGEELNPCNKHLQIDTKIDTAAGINIDEKGVGTDSTTKTTAATSDIKTCSKTTVVSPSINDVTASPAASEIIGELKKMFMDSYGKTGEKLLVVRTRKQPSSIDFAAEADQEKSVEETTCDLNENRNDVSQKDLDENNEDQTNPNNRNNLNIKSDLISIYKCKETTSSTTKIGELSESSLCLTTEEKHSEHIKKSASDTLGDPSSQSVSCKSANMKISNISFGVECFNVMQPYGDINTSVEEKRDVIETVDDHKKLLSSVYGIVFTVMFLGLNMQYSC